MHYRPSVVSRAPTPPGDLRQAGRRTTFDTSVAGCDYNARFVCGFPSPGRGHSTGQALIIVGDIGNTATDAISSGAEVVARDLFGVAKAAPDSSDTPTFIDVRGMRRLFPNA